MLGGFSLWFFLGNTSPLRIGACRMRFGPILTAGRLAENCLGEDGGGGVAAHRVSWFVVMALRSDWIACDHCFEEILFFEN